MIMIAKIDHDNDEMIVMTRARTRMHMFWIALTRQYETNQNPDASWGGRWNDPGRMLIP